MKRRKSPSARLQSLAARQRALIAHMRGELIQAIMCLEAAAEHDQAANQALRHCRAAFDGALTPRTRPVLDDMSYDGECPF